MTTENLYYYKAEIVRVIDGDTLEVDIDLGFDRIRTRQKLRLLRVNTPERKTSDTWRAATEITSDIVFSSKTIVIQTVKKDSFGRWLSEVWCDGVNLNDILVEHGFVYVAKPG